MLKNGTGEPWQSRWQTLFHPRRYHCPIFPVRLVTAFPSVVASLHPTRLPTKKQNSIFTIQYEDMHFSIFFTLDNVEGYAIERVYIIMCLFVRTIIQKFMYGFG